MSAPEARSVSSAYLGAPDAAAPEDEPDFGDDLQTDADFGWLVPPLPGEPAGEHLRRCASAAETSGIADAPQFVLIPEDQDHLVSSVPLYDFLMSAPMSPDPWVIWSFYQRTARRQGTRSVWATNPFIAKGTKLGVRRVREAKAWLAGVGLICYRKGRGKGGTVARVYTLLNGAVPTGTRAVPVAKRTTGTDAGRPVNHRVQTAPGNASGDLGNPLGVKKGGSDNQQLSLSDGPTRTESPSGQTPPSATPGPERSPTTTLIGDIVAVHRRERSADLILTESERASIAGLAHNLGSVAVLRAFRAWCKGKPRTTPLRFFLTDAREWITASQRTTDQADSDTLPCGFCGEPARYKTDGVNMCRKCYFQPESRPKGAA